MAASNWTIIGNNPLAETLRSVARYIDAATPITIATEPGDIPEDAFVLGPAAIQAAAGRVVPFYGAFEAVEEIARELQSGSVGRVYGCYVSLRLPRGTSGEALAYNAVIPSIALALDLLPGNPTRLWAKRASLITDNDAWFVTIRFDDDIIATIEALATTDATPERELLLELTGSDRVLRAEPTRQSVVVERVGAKPIVSPWWEDLGERYLQLLTRRAGEPDRDSASRLRTVWDAAQQSGVSGEPVVIER